MFSQVDGEGNRHVLIEEIIDHQNYGLEVNQKYSLIKTRNGKKC